MSIKIFLNLDSNLHLFKKKRSWGVRGIKEHRLKKNKNTPVLNGALGSAYSHTHLHKFHSLSRGPWLECVISVRWAVVQPRHAEACCYLTQSTLVLHPAGPTAGSKIVGSVLVWIHVCLDARKKKTGVRCLRVCEKVLVREGLCVVVFFFSPCDVCLKEHTGREHAVCV